MTSIETLYGHFLKSSGVSTDTRKIEANNLFYALKGPNFNGNTYAAMALEKGASFVVIDEASYKTDDRMLLVPDVLTALQQLANHHRKQLTIPFIGIAGSNGKTTTKELTYAVLAKKFKTFATKGNLNNHIGVPLTLLSIDKSIEMAILELGANHVGELEFLCKIAEPNFGIVTNNGLDHLEGYGNFEGVVQGNSELYYWLIKNKGVVFVNSKDEILMRMAARFEKPITYGQKGNYFSAEVSGNEFFLKVTTEAGIDIQTQLIGEYNIDNINTALCIGKYMGVAAKDGAAAIEAYVPANNRSQLLKKESNAIILDCYNANPSSMESSIESFSKINAANKIVMLGDMFEMGEHSEKEHRKLIDFLSKKDFKAVFLCGSDFAKSKKELPNFYYFETRTDLENYIKNHPISNASILIKGSRGMTMEKLVEYL